MKVIEPGPLLREAADVLGPRWTDAVLIGAAALQALLADDVGADGGAAAADDGAVVFIAATRDVDLAIEARIADDLVRHLEAAQMRPSEVEGERGFTWVRGDLKIQLVRPFHPFPRGAAAGLPTSPQLSLLNEEQHRFTVGFASEPAEPRLQVASTAAFVALKQLAFGRARYDGSPVERDYHDVYAIIASRPNEFEQSYRAANNHVRELANRALEALAASGGETAAAARQHAETTGNQDIASHARAIQRAAVFMQRRLGY